MKPIVLAVALSMLGGTRRFRWPEHVDQMEHHDACRSSAARRAARTRCATPNSRASRCCNTRCSASAATIRHDPLRHRQGRGVLRDRRSRGRARQPLRRRRQRQDFTPATSRSGASAGTPRPGRRVASGPTGRAADDPPAIVRLRHHRRHDGAVRLGAAALRPGRAARAARRGRRPASCRTTRRSPASPTTSSSSSPRRCWSAPRWRAPA